MSDHDRAKFWRDSTPEHLQDESTSTLDDARRHLARCQMHEQASLNKYKTARSRRAQLAKAAWLEAKAATVRAEVELAEALGEANDAAA